MAIKRNSALTTYRKKRNFRETPEPAGKPAAVRSNNPIFVIQKHDATRLHYDFRIESGGVLKSWAIPKGPSTNPRDRRLAVPTEDHPIEYAEFEGVIPQGHYGAGTVIVWDLGTYQNLSERNGRELPIGQAVREGRVKIRLDGRKLKGGYALTRIRTAPETWLLVKMKDAEAGAKGSVTKSQPRSVLSGRSIEELEQQAA